MIIRIIYKAALIFLTVINSVYSKDFIIKWYTMVTKLDSIIYFKKFFLISMYESNLKKNELLVV